MDEKKDTKRRPDYSQIFLSGNRQDKIVWRFPFGKFVGKSLDEIGLVELDSYLGWMEGINNKSDKMIEAVENVTAYLHQPDNARALERELESEGE